MYSGGVTDWKCNVLHYSGFPSLLVYGHLEAEERLGISHKLEIEPMALKTSGSDLQIDIAVPVVPPGRPAPAFSDLMSREAIALYFGMNHDARFAGALTHQG